MDRKYFEIGIFEWIWELCEEIFRVRFFEDHQIDDLYSIVEDGRRPEAVPSPLFPLLAVCPPTSLVKVGMKTT